MTSVRLPRLLNNDFSEARRLQPVDGSLDLNMVPLSTASLTVLTKDAAPVGSWVEMCSPNGSAGIYRVSSVNNGHGTELTSLELEHGIAEVGNYVVNGEISDEMPLNVAISQLWGFYKGNRWRIGSNAFTDRVLVDVLYDNLLQAILDLLEQTSGYMMAFDFSTNPWTINIVRKDTEVSAEGRLSRNVEEAHVTYDLTELCTRVYVDYDADDSAGGAVSMDADTISQYGIIEKHISGTGYTYSQAQAVAREYLEKHKKPQIGATIAGVDFASVTGELLDRLAIGKLYRLAIPKYNVVIEQHISSLSWSHLYSDPSAVEISLGVEEDRVVSYMQHTTETVAKSGKGTIKKQGRYWTKFDRTDHYIDQVAAYTDENGNILKQAGMYIDANGVLQYAQDNEKQIGSQFKVAADRIAAEVTQRENGERTLYSSIEQTASQIRSEVVDVKEGLESSITQTADRIDLDIKNTKEGLESQISQTDSDIRLFVGGVKSDLQSEIEVERNRIGLVVSGTGANAKIRPAQIVASINNSESSILLNADKIRLSGATTINDIITIQNNYMRINAPLIVSSGDSGFEMMYVNGTLYVNRIAANSVEVPYHYTTRRTLNVADVQASGNTLTITYVDGTTANFSKAATLGVEYGGDNTGDTATYTVTGSPAGIFPSGNVVTGYFTVKQSKTAAYIQDPTGTIRARINNPQYGNGWAAAYGKVSLPTSSSTADNFSVSTPPSTVDGSATVTKYTLSNPMNNVAVVKNPSGTIVARLEHNKYDAGYVAGWNAARAKVSRSGDTIYRPKARSGTDASTDVGTEAAYTANYTASSHSNNRKASAEGYYKIGTTGSSVDLEGSGSTSSYAMTLIPKANVTAGVYIYIKPAVSGGDSYTASSFNWTDH